jgi:hypothetical protein
LSVAAPIVTAPKADQQPAPSGVPAYVPAGATQESDVLDAARQLGIPLVRTSRFPTGSPVAFFSTASLTDQQFSQRLRSYVKGGGRALLTSRLAGRQGRLPSEFAQRIFVLPSRDGARTVLALPQVQVDRLRNFALFPLGLRMEAPPRVSLSLIGREALVLENGNSFAAGVKLTFLTGKWPKIQALSSDETEIPLAGSTVALQAPPKARQRFEIVSR